MSSSDAASKKGSAMAAPVRKSKSSMAALVESFESLVESQRKKLSKEEFKKAEEKFDRIVTKARASRGRRRETA
jgi:hypothetical protein